jgi:3-methyladenine DNA glycosylase/8-oxoguanine DNA glycosylase
MVRSCNLTLTPLNRTSVLGRDVVSLRQINDDNVEFCVNTPTVLTDGALVDATERIRARLHRYFMLNVKLVDLYADWSRNDDTFKRIAGAFIGIRILQIDPVECLFSFICSSNNNIARIASMVQKLTIEYGDPLGRMSDIDFYTFPEPHRLVGSGMTLIMVILICGQRCDCGHWDLDTVQSTLIRRP